MNFSRIVVPCLAAAIISSASAAKEKKTLPIRGYESVPLERGPRNHLIIHVLVNGHSGRFLVDTGAPVTSLEKNRARSFGVGLAGVDSPYGQFHYSGSQTLRTGLVRSLRAGSMDFGQGPMALFEWASPTLSAVARANRGIDGILGADILKRYKAVINCRTEQIFFKTSSDRSLHLTSFTSAMGFKRVPMREEDDRHFSVPCKINGHSVRALVDTGAFVTIFDKSIAQSFGVKSQPSRLTAIGFAGKPYPIDLALFDQLSIGDFKVPPQKLAVAGLPTFLRGKGTSRQAAGIIGSELLALNRGIIDFDSMSLFLK
jgi:predicted aspartyl protease